MRTLLRSCLLVGLTFANLPKAHSADLNFETKEHFVRMTAGQSTFTVVYPFTNNAATRVFVVGIEASCGCTNVNTDTEFYEPGQAGEVQATFKVGNLEGTLARDIKLRTNGLKAEEYNLRLKVEIPSLVTVDPKYLTWSGDEPLAAKTITVKCAPEIQIASLELSEAQGFFTWAATRHGNEWTLVITPRTNRSGMSTALMLEFMGESTAIRRTVMLRIRPNPSEVSPLR